MPIDGFDKEKFKQVLHYIIARCGDSDNVGRTVLYKLSYFLDFDYYELYEEKLTGELYRKIPRGPAPIHFEEVVRELEREGKITESESVYGNFPQFRYRSTKKPMTGNLAARELKVIEDVIKKYSCKNATEISEISHRDMPYKATRNSDIIDYELVFYRDGSTSVRDYDENN
jgi:molybdopterin/thiamine biosynthesis adenylyltransferase